MSHPETDIKEVKTWTKGNLKLKILWVRDHYCGYVTFPKRLFREQGYNGFLVYVPVHGGITFAEQEKDGSMTYGFDCAHAGDYTGPVYEIALKGDKIWQEDMVIVETEKLAKGLQLAQKYELRYLRNISNKGKAKVIDEYHKELGEPFDMKDNFGVMLNLLGGKI
jgi:hypothetical protein